MWKRSIKYGSSHIFAALSMSMCACFVNFTKKTSMNLVQICNYTTISHKRTKPCQMFNIKRISSPSYNETKENMLVMLYRNAP